MKPFEEEILYTDEPSSMEVCTSGMAYQQLTFDPGKSSAATYLPCNNGIKYRHDNTDTGTGNLRDAVGKGKLEEINRLLKFEQHSAIMKERGAKQMKVSKDAQNVLQIQRIAKDTKTGTKSEKSTCSDNKQSYERKDHESGRTENCKTMKLLGGKQDKRISKESEKLHSFHYRRRVLQEGRKIFIDKNGKRKEVKFIDRGRLESKKITKDFVETEQKTKQSKGVIQSHAEGITSVKEISRQPAENDDITNSMVLAEVGGNNNSFTECQYVYMGGEQKSLANSNRFRDSNLEEDEEEEIDIVVKGQSLQEKETEWIAGYSHESNDKPGTKTEKALNLGSKSIISLADPDPLFEKKKPYHSANLSSKDAKNLLLKDIHMILNVMMSTVLRRLCLAAYENGPCCVTALVPFTQPLPSMTKKSTIEAPPLVKMEKSTEVSEETELSLKQRKMETIEEDKIHDCESNLGSNHKLDLDAKELLNGVNASLERSQDIALQTEHLMDKVQMILDEWTFTVRGLYMEDDRNSCLDDVNLCLQDAKPSSGCSDIKNYVYPMKKTDAEEIGVSSIEGISKQPPDVRDPNRNIAVCPVKASRKGDKSDWNNPKDSNSGSSSNQGWKKYDKEASEKESRNQDDEKEKDEQEDPSPGDVDIRTQGNGGPHLTYEENASFKFRRKENHGKVDETDLMQFLGFLSENDEDIPPDLLNKGKNVEEIFAEVNKCLMLSLRKHSSEKELGSCSICLYVDSMIQHFGKCPTEYRSQESLICTMCLQLFRLIQTHVQQCVENGERECKILVCRKISYLIESDRTMIFTKAAKIWKKLKKHLLGFVNVPIVEGEIEEDEECFSMTPLVSVMMSGSGLPHSAPLNRSLRISTSFSPNLPFIPEDNKDLSLNIRKQDRPPPTKPISKSEPICRRRLDGVVEMLTGPKSATPATRPQNLTFPDKFDGKALPPSRMISPGGSNRLGVVGPPDDAFSVLTPSGAKRPEKIPEKRPLKVSFSNEIPKEKLSRKVSNASSLPSPIRTQQGIFATTDVDLDAHPGQSTGAQPTENEDIEPLQPTSISELSESSSLGDKKTYGEHLHSMPMNRSPWRNEDQILSLVDRPTGIPGIGEVVYGERDIFRFVIRYWMDLKMEYKENGRILQKQIREEGVIFPDCRKQLMIMKSRYQKNFQWIRLTHLGRGMSGNCHLASDYNSDYQFCIKKIHISKYQEEELLIWSDLEHPSIVKLHGALRRKEKIYIISEFIGGGSLTETINAQKRMTRRLSHWMALNYFKQILRVLKYLQKKNVLHEDLKADNILLRSDSHKVAVADFGVAVRIHNNTTPPGYTTKGTPTQFSPEKAMGIGHSYKADLWAAVCILVHMLSGNPPWVKRFPNARMLNFLIVEKDPPTEDVPKNVSIDVMDLIEQGFQKDPKMRTSVNELLQHRAFGLLDSTPDTFTSTLLTSIHQLPDTQLPIEGPIHQEQSAIIEQIEHEIRHPPGGSTSQSANNHEGTFQKGTMSVLLNNNVEMREDLSKLGHTQPESNVNNNNQTVNLHEKEKIGQTIDFSQSAKISKNIGNEKFMKVEAPVRSLDDFRMDSMRKAMAADAKEFMPDKSQKQDLYNDFINDNFNNDNNDIVVYLATETNTYNPLPEYKASGSEEGLGSESLGGASGSAMSEKQVIPELEMLLATHSENEETTEYIDQLHNMVLQSQLSKTSTASKSDEDMRRSVSRSSSQMYSDADKEYQNLQDSVLKKLQEVQEDNVFDENTELSSQSDEAKSSQTDNNQDISRTAVEFENPDESRDSNGEPISSLHYPILTPFTEQSDEKTPEAVPQVGNLPVFISDFNTSNTTLSEKSRNSKSVDTSSVTDGQVDEKELKTEKLKVNRKPEDFAVGVPDDKEQKSFVTEQSEQKEQVYNTTEITKKEKKESDVFAVGMHAEVDSSVFQTSKRIKHSGKEIGPQSLPAVLPSTKPTEVVKVSQEPMSMFIEEEDCLSDELFGDLSEAELSQPINSPNSYTQEINMAAYSPNESSSSETSFNKVQKFPNKSFKPFKVEEERPYIGNPSIYMEDSDSTQVMGITGNNSSRDSDGLNLSLGIQNSRKPIHRQLPPLDVNKNPKDLRKNRLSTPSFRVASPVTPQKFSTPQVGHRSSPFLGLKKNDTVTTGLGSSVATTPPNKPYKFPTSHRQDSSYYSTSPKSWSQVDESDRKIREYVEELSQASNDSFIIHKDVDNPGLDFENYDEENFEESLHYTLSQYIQNDDEEAENKRASGIKVRIELPNKDCVEYRLTAEYYRTEWLKIIERDISAEIHQRGVPVFTLYKGEVPLELHNSPGDLDNNELLHLSAMDVKVNKNDYPWHCEGGVCKNEHGIPY